MSSSFFQPMLKSNNDNLIYQISSVIYQFNCPYVVGDRGRSTQLLEIRVSQCVPAYIRKGQSQNFLASLFCNAWMMRFNPTMRLCVGCLNSSHSDFFLKVLPALFINSLQPCLCKHNG